MIKVGKPSIKKGRFLIRLVASCLVVNTLGCSTGNVGLIRKY